MRKAPLTLTMFLTMLLAAVAFSLPALASDEVFDRTIPLSAGEWSAVSHTYVQFLGVALDDPGAFL